MVDTQRYWDGSTWTEHRAPAAAAAQAMGTPGAPLESSPAVPDTWAWIVAGSPLLAVLIVFAVPGQALATLVPGVVALVAAVVDANVLARTVKMGAGAGLLAFFLPPLYLVLRTIRARSTPFIPIAWVLALLVTLALANILSV